MKIEEILFLETENSCAYCRDNQRDNLSIHHIDGNRTNKDYDNQIVLCHNCHHRVTNRKGIYKRDIINIKKILIYKTLTQYGVNALKIAYRKKGRIVAIPFLLYHLVDMGYFKQTETQLWQDDVDILANFELTEEGERLFCRWFLK